MSLKINILSWLTTSQTVKMNYRNRQHFPILIFQSESRYHYLYLYFFQNDMIFTAQIFHFRQAIRFQNTNYANCIP